MLITVPEAHSVAWLLKSQTADLRSVVVPHELMQNLNNALYPPANTNDIAFLQYTSGSTGNPKGVVLTHANLLANIRAMGLATRIRSTDVFVSWLPLYHDMGLIGAWLGSLYYAAPLVLMSPLDFLTRPERWLRAIHRYRGTLSAAPNFAYELCLKKIKDSDIQGVDLGSWRMACNGAEPVSVASMIAFRERFAAYGFRPEAIAPVYGLAESSVGLAFPSVGRGLHADRIRRDEFMSTGHAVPAEDSDKDALVFAAAGFPLPGHQIRIIDNMGHELPERMEGRLEFCGPSATSGYFRNQQDTRRLFHGQWLDSGDLAYQAAGEIYITGRSKDIIIKAGRNIYPYELEEAVGAVPGIRKGCVAVFGSSDPVSGTERLIVLAETREKAPEMQEQLRDQINGLALDLLGSPPDDIVLAPPHTVLKTSSGKIRRAASRQFYEQGGRAVHTAPVWLQFIRLACSGAVTQSRNLMSAVLKILYAAYIWCLFATIAPIAWLLACLMPFPNGSWAVSRAIARTFLSLAGIRLDIEGTENLPEDTSCILVANHSSYLDGLVLVAALPGCYGFVAKRELENSFISRRYLQRMGCEFVERFDFQQGVEDIGRISESATKGRSLIFFPEGTFSRRPGLMQFKMGAFLVGAQTSTAVVPVTIRGTRSILHPDSWFPRRGKVSITISHRLKESETDWDAAIRLKDAARAEILRQCGEPDLSDS
jgi:1-acyl-sn-glycerol-3-phosphate acyltransferase